MAMEKEDKAYADLSTAEDEVAKIFAEIDQVLKSTSDRLAAEKIVVEQYAPRVDEAMKKSRAAFDKWMQEGRDLMKETEDLLREEP